MMLMPSTSLHSPHRVNLQGGGGGASNNLDFSLQPVLNKKREQKPAASSIPRLSTYCRIGSNTIVDGMMSSSIATLVLILLSDYIYHALLFMHAAEPAYIIELSAAARHPASSRIILSHISSICFHYC